MSQHTTGHLHMISQSPAQLRVVREEKSAHCYFVSVARPFPSLQFVSLIFAAMSADWRLYGERAVIVLYLSRIILSAPRSLLHEAAALSLLSFASFLVEITAKDVSAFSYLNTRPGASTGIFLGSVTLPSVILSRLIQMSRLTADHVSVQEGMEYLNMQYWAVSICCTGVLIFFCSVFRHSTNGKCLYPICQDTAFGSLLLITHAIFCWVSLPLKTPSGFLIAMRSIWLLLHAFASVKLFQHVLCTFPMCASTGEALLVTCGVVLYSGDMLAFTLSKLGSQGLPFNISLFLPEIHKSEIGTVMEVMLFGILLLPIFYKIVLLLGGFFSNKICSNTPENEGIERSILFYVSLAVLVILIIPGWMQFVLGFQVHPIKWFLLFVFREPYKRLSLMAYWVIILWSAVFQFYRISKHSKVERILLRKYYHLVAVLMFVPALLFQPEFLELSFGVALAVFLVLETIRVFRIWPVGHLINQFMNAFTDHRDSEILIVSHFSLLLGCALPKWMSSGFNDRPLAPFAGILSLGIGDAMASMVGHKYGVVRWSKSGNKTVEGTAAGITSVGVACLILTPLLASTGFLLSQHWLSLLVAVILSGLLEAYTTQLDNAFIPLVFYSLLCL